MRVRARFWLSNRVTVVVFGFLALIELPSIVASGKGGVGAQIFAAVLVALCVTLAARALRCGSLLATSEGITVRALSRTRRWPWGDVREVSVVSAPVGAAAHARLMLAMTLTSGQTIRITEINYNLRSTTGADLLASASTALNRLAANATATRPTAEGLPSTDLERHQFPAP